MKSALKRGLLKVIVVFLIIAFLSVSYIYYKKIYLSDEALRVSKIEPELDYSQTIEKAGMLIELPKGEAPTVTTVSDKEKPKNEPFIEKSQPGDKILIYSEAKKAFLFRPSINKIIDVGLFDLPSEPPPPTPIPVQTATPSAKVKSFKVSILNGTQVSGLASKIQNILKTNTRIVVVSKGNAKDKYDKSLVVVLNSQSQDLASDIAKILKADLGDLSSMESKPKDIDILIIAGKDQT